MKLGRIVGSSFVLGTVVALAAACSSDPGADAAIEVAPPEARPGALKEVPRCDDSIPNGEETDTDCGGPTCGKCGMKMGCKDGVDCQSGVCIHGLCEGSLSANGQKDGQETDVDCGGPEAVACATGKACREDGDCEGSLCEAGVCGDRAPEPPAPASDDVIDTDSTPKALPGLGQAVNKALPVPGQQFVAFTTKSCATNGAGRNTCGANGNESCCRTIQVPGGTFKRFNNNSLPATISSFKLDKYEVTQGRLRKFFQSKGGNLKGSPPAAGAGAHPKIANSGWRSAWNKRLPGSNAEIDGRLTWGCAFGSDNNNYGSTTWSSSANDNKPVTCVDWYTAFAFCAWDGGRLPTAAEWSYAAEGGSYQRAYAWGGSAPKYADANNQGYQRTVWYLKENGGGFDGWQMTWPSNKFWQRRPAPHRSPGLQARRRRALGSHGYERQPARVGPRPQRHPRGHVQRLRERQLPQPQRERELGVPAQGRRHGRVGERRQPRARRRVVGGSRDPELAPLRQLPGVAHVRPRRLPLRAQLGRNRRTGRGESEVRLDRSRCQPDRDRSDGLGPVRAFSRHRTAVSYRIV